MNREQDYVGLTPVADIGPNQDVDGWDKW